MAKKRLILPQQTAVDPQTNLLEDQSTKRLTLPSNYKTPNKGEDMTSEDMISIINSDPNNRATPNAFGNYSNLDFRGVNEAEMPMVAGIDNFRLRALNQGGWEQTKRSLGNLLPNIAAGILENVGYLAALATEWGDERDYTNGLVEWSQSVKDPFGETYRLNPEETWDIGDSAWWLQHGFGLVESIGVFLATGMGVGSVLGKGASITAQALRMGAKGTKMAMRTAQAATSFTLGYVEGAMSAAQVYKDTYDHLQNQFDPETGMAYTEDAKRRLSSDAAAVTARTNTIMIGLLNLTSVVPLFKSNKWMRELDDMGVNRLKKPNGKWAETIDEWKARLNNIQNNPTAAGFTPPGGSLKKVYVRESLQEGIEEVSNLYSETRGRQYAGLEEEEYSGGLFDFNTFFDKAFSSEGALNFLLGAVGGVAQTSGMRNIPYHRVAKKDDKGEIEKDSEGNTVYEWQSSFNVENEQAMNKRMNYAKTIKEDIEGVTTALEDLRKASEAGDEAGISEAKRTLFKIGTLRSLHMGAGEALLSTYREIAATDNTEVDENGLTEAMRKGLAQDTNDNAYVDQANKFVTDIEHLSEKYENMMTQYNYGDEESYRLGEYLFNKYTTSYLLKSELEERREELDKRRRSNAVGIGKRGTDFDFVKGAEIQKTMDAITKALERQQSKLEGITKILENGTESQKKALYKKYAAKNNEEVYDVLEGKSEYLHNKMLELKEQIQEEYDSFRESKKGKKKYHVGGKNTENALDEGKIEKAWEEALAKNTVETQDIQALASQIEYYEAEQASINDLFDKVNTSKGRAAFVKEAKEKYQEDIEQIEKADKAQKEAEKAVEKAKKTAILKDKRAKIKKEQKEQKAKEQKNRNQAKKEDTQDPNATASEKDKTESQKLADDLANELEEDDLPSIHEDELPVPGNNPKKDNSQKIFDLTKKLLASLKKDGIDTNDFKAVSIKMADLLGEDRFKNLFVKFKGNYMGITGVDASGINWGDVFLTKNENSALDSDNSSNKPKGLNINENSRSKELSETLKSLDNANEDDPEGTSRDTKGNFLGVGFLIVPAGNALAWRAKDFVKQYGDGSVRKITSSEELNNTLHEPLLMSPNKFHIGTKVTITVDTGFKVFSHAPGVMESYKGTKYEKILIENGELVYEDLKDDIDRIPIVVKANGKIIGYLHTPDWINTENVARSIKGDPNNIATQLKLSKAIRSAVLMAPGQEISSEIASKGHGKLNKLLKDESGFTALKPVSEVIGDPKLQFGIGKNGLPFTSSDSVYSESLLNNTTKNPLRDGAPYILAYTNLGTRIALPVMPMKMGEKQVYIKSIIKAIEIHYSKDRNSTVAKQLLDNYNIDILTTEGLKEYINLFIFTKSLNPGFIENIKADVDSDLTGDIKKYFLDVNSDSHGNTYINFISNGDTPGVVKSPKTFDELKERLTSHISEMFITSRLDLLEDSSKPFSLPLITEDNRVESDGSINTYRDFMANNTKADFMTNELPDGTHAYFIQPVITLSYSSETLEGKPEIIRVDVSDGDIKPEIKIKVPEGGVVHIKPRSIGNIKLPPVSFDTNEMTDDKTEDEFPNLLPAVPVRDVLSQTQKDILEKSLAEIRVEGFSSEKTQKITNIINAYAFEFLKYNEHLPKSERVSLNDAYKYAKASIFEYGVEIMNSTNKDPKIFQEVLDNWDKFTIVSKNHLRRIGLVNKQGNISSNNTKQEQDIDLETTELLDYDSNFEKITYADEASFLIDPRTTLGAKIRKMLAFVPTGTKNYLGLNNYKTFDQVTQLLSSELNGIEPNFNSVIARLQEVSEKHEWVNELINVLQNATDQEKNELVVFGSKHYAPFRMVLWNSFIKKRREPGMDKVTSYTDPVTGELAIGYNMQVVEANRSTIDKVILRFWGQNIFTTDLVVEHTTLGEYIIDTKEAQKRVEKFDELIKSKEVSIKDTQKWLNSIGIEISTDALKYIKANAIKEFKSTWYAMFTSKGGVFKTIRDRLALNEQGTEDTENLLDLNNPTLDNSGVRKLAQIEARFKDDIFSNSHKDGRGNTIFSYSQNKSLSHAVNSLKRDKENIKTLLSTPFSATSIWGKELAKGNYFSDVFSLGYIDTLKKRKSRRSVNKYSQLSPREHEVSRLSLFQNGGKGREVGQKKDYISHFMFLTPSDKSTVPVITSLRFHVNDYIVNNKVEGTAVDALFTIVQGEIDRILHFQNPDHKEDYEKIKGLKDGAGSFHFFPLNKDDFLKGEKSIWDTNGLLTINPDTIEIIRGKLDTFVKELVKEKLEQWKELGIITENEKGISINYMDAGYIKNTRGHISNKTNKGIVDYAAYDFVINQLLAHGNMFQLFAGDPALYHKLSKKDEASVADHIQETFNNIGKRLAQEIAPGLDLADSDTNVYQQLFIKDREGTSKYLKEYTKVLGEVANGYKNIEITDAQEYTTLQEHLYILEKLGKISPKEAKDLLAKGKAGTLNMIERRKVLQPAKPVYSKLIINPDTRIARKVYIKSSSIPLIPQLVKGLELDKLRVYMEKNNISRVAHDTAVKTGAPTNAPQIYNEDGSIDVSKIDEAVKADNDVILTLPRSGFRIQQELPWDEKKKNITAGSQEMRMLFNNILNIPGMDTKNIEYLQTWDKVFKLAESELKEKLGLHIDTETGEISSINMDKLKTLLLEEGIIRGFNPNTLASLGLVVNEINRNKEFVLPLWASSGSEKFQSLIYSIIKNKVLKQKLPGFSAALVSDSGFQGVKTWDDLSTDERSDMVFIEGFDVKGGLKPMRKGPKGEILPAQVIAPFKFKGKDGQILNVKKFIVEKDGKKYLDTTKIDPELLKHFGFRIPTQGHNSMSYIEVVGFMPYEMQDALIAPKEFIVQMGSDFDIDKLYAYMYNYKYEDKKLTKVASNEETKKSLQNKLLDIHLEVMTNPGVFEYIIEPLEFGKLKRKDKNGVEIGRAKFVNDARIKRLRANKSFLPLSAKHQQKKFLDGRSGQQGISAFSANQALSSLLQIAEKNSGSPISMYREEFIDGKVVRIPITIQFGKGKSILKSQELSGSRSISDPKRTRSSVIASFQSASVDNENEQILDKLNVNNETFGVYYLISQAGFDEDFSTGLISQDIIFEYVEKILNAKDSLGVVSKSFEELEADILEELLDKYGGMIPGFSTMNDAQKEELQKDVPLTLEQMDDMIENGPEAANYAKGQISTLVKFLQIKQISQSLRNISSHLNTGPSNMPALAIHSMHRENQLGVRLINEGDIIKFSNIGYALGAPITDPKVESKSLLHRFESSTINAFFTRGLMLGNSIARNFFPFDSVAVNRVFENISIINSRFASNSEQGIIGIHPDMQRQVIGAMTSWHHARSSTESTIMLESDIVNERKRLLIDSGGPITKGVKEFFLGKKAMFVYDIKEVVDTVPKGAQIYKLKSGKSLFQFAGNEEKVLNGSKTTTLRNYSYTDGYYKVGDKYIKLTKRSDKKLYIKDVAEGMDALYASEAFPPINKSLATKIADFKKTKKGRKNILIQRLVTNINKGKASTITYDAGSAEDFDESPLHNAFIELFLDPETEELAKDLVSYAYINGGIQGNREFLKFIPFEYLLLSKYASSMRTTLFSDENSYGLLPSFEFLTVYEKLSSFAIQWVQHNPDAAPRITDIKKQLANVNKIKNGKRNIITSFTLHPDIEVTGGLYVFDVVQEAYVPTPFISMANSSATSGYDLYMYQDTKDEPGKYVKIDTLGHISGTEYNPSVKIGTTSDPSNKGMEKITSPTKPIKTPTKTEKKSTIQPQYNNPSKNLKRESTYNLKIAEENKSILPVLDGILQNTVDPGHKLLADLLSKMVKNINPDVTFYIDNEKLKSTASFGFLPTYQHRRVNSESVNRIRLNRDHIDRKGGVSENMFEIILLHETLHSVTSPVLHHNPANPISGSFKITPEQKKAAKQLDNLRKRLKKKIKNGELETLGFSPSSLESWERAVKEREQEGHWSMETIKKFEHETGAAFLTWYGLYNPAEFITGAMTDPGFRSLLNNIQDEAYDQSFWTRVLNIITNFVASFTFKDVDGKEVKVKDKSYLKSVIGNVVTIAMEESSTIYTDTKVDPGFKYYGRLTNVIINKEGVAIDIHNYTQNQESKQKILDAYNLDPTVDPQNGKQFRSKESLPQSIKPSKPKQQTNEVKEGVQELFESNSELANEVYEAAGFKQESNLSEKNIFTVEPIQSVDKKAKSKAKIATQYIGFAEGIAGSSTALYAKQAGQYSNTGNYSSNDTVFVSIGGKRGNEALRKQQQDKTINEAIKALEAGATLITDNAAYVESNSYNEGEKRLAANLKAKGYNYSETTIDGNLLGVWNKNTNQITPQQKQQAQQLYSQYIEQTSKQDIEGFKEFVSGTQQTSEVDLGTQTAPAGSKVIIDSVKGKSPQPGAVVAFRTKGKTEQHMIDALKDNVVGNPFGPYAAIKENDIGTAVTRFLNWLEGTADTNIMQDYRQALLAKVPELEGKTIFYYKDLGRPSHATALDYFLNKEDTQPTTTQQTSEVKSSKAKIKENNSIIFNDGVEISTGDIKVNTDQKDALLAMADFIGKGKDATFALKGYAGTGKTTIVEILLKYVQKTKPFKSIRLSSPTHRANAVLRQKANKNNTRGFGVSVVTLHKLLGLSPEMDLDEYDATTAKFVKKNNLKMGREDLVIIDESSMINDSLYKEITTTAKKLGAMIIFVGDPAQLKPVKQNKLSKAFNEVDQQAELTIVERTGNNPLLKESMDVRQASPTGQIFNKVSRLNKDGEGVIFTESSEQFLTQAMDLFNSKEFIKNPLLVRMISGTNRVVTELNEAIRKGIWGEDARNEYNVGEILMGYNNWSVSYSTGEPVIANGGDYKVTQATLLDTAITNPVSGEVRTFNGTLLILENLVNPETKPEEIFMISKNTSKEDLTWLADQFEHIRETALKYTRQGEYGAAAKTWQKLADFQNRFGTPVDIKHVNPRTGYAKIKIKKTLSYGYAHTIHKSQGGTYEYSFVHDKSIGVFKDASIRQQLKYVGITRASKQAIILTTNVKESQPIIEEKVSEDLLPPLPSKKEIKSIPNDARTTSQLVFDIQKEFDLVKWTTVKLANGAQQHLPYYKEFSLEEAIKIRSTIFNNPNYKGKVLISAIPSDTNSKKAILDITESKKYQNLKKQNKEQEKQLDLFEDQLPAISEETTTEETKKIINPFEKAINYKKSRITNVNKTLVKVRNNPNKYAKFSAIKQKLENDIEVLKKSDQVHHISQTAEADLKEANALLSQAKLSVDDTKYAMQLLDQVARITEFWSHSINEDVGLVSSLEELVPDEDGELSANIKRLKEIASNAETVKLRLHEIQKSILKQIVSAEVDRNISGEEVEVAKEVDFGTAYFLDISRSGNIVASAMDMWGRDSAFRVNAASKKVWDKLDTVSQKLQKNSTFKSRGYDIFMQKDSSGKRTGRLVGRYSQDYYDEKAKRRNKAIRSKKSTDWKKYFSWVAKNEIIFDLRKLFYSDYTDPLGEVTFTKKDKEVHIKELKEVLGEDGFNEYMNSVTVKYNDYTQQKSAAFDLIEVTNDDSAIIERLKSEWEAHNSPFVYADKIHRKIVTKLGGEFINPKGYLFTESIPRQKINDKTTNWYDKDFNIIKSDAVLNEFYEYTTELLDELFSYFPPHMLENMPENSLPELKKTLLKDVFSSKGMSGMFSKLNDRIIEAITSSDTSDTVYGELDPVTNQRVKSIPAGMLPSQEKIREVVKVKAALFLAENGHNPDPSIMQVFRKEATQEHIESLETDLTKIIKVFAGVAYSYKYKSQVEDKLKLAHTVINRALEQQMKADGSTPKKTRFGEAWRTKNSLDNLRAQIDYYMDSFYGEGRPATGVTSYKKYTSKEKAVKATIDAAVLQLEAQFENGSINEVEYEERLNQLQDAANSIGRNVTISKIGDGIIQYVQLKGMGWNVMSAATNMFYGTISNVIYANRRADFTRKDLRKATGIMLNATMKSLTGDLYENKQAKKVMALMLKFDTLKEFNEEAFSATTDPNRTKRGLSKLAPYELQRRSEYFVQGQTMVSMMLAVKLKDKAGNEVSLFEAYDEHGEWNVEKMGENTEWAGNIDIEGDNEMSKKFKFKLDQILKRVHGNYDPNSPVMIKKGVFGRMLMQFRSWVSEGFAERFEGEKEDTLLGRARKGRYRTYGKLGLMGSIKTLLKQLAYSKSAFIDPKTGKKMDDVDVENMRANLSELAFALGMYAFVVMLKHMWDDDDEKPAAYYFFINTAFRLQDDIAFYINPNAFENISKNAIPVFGLVTDVGEFVIAAEKYIAGDDLLKSGPYKGESRVLREFSQMIPLGTPIYRFRSGTAQQLKK